MTAWGKGSADADDLIDRRMFLTRREVAERFGRSERTVANWERAGRLRARRVGRSVFYSIADVDQLTGDGPVVEE